MEEQKIQQENNQQQEQNFNQSYLNQDWYKLLEGKISFQKIDEIMDKRPYEYKKFNEKDKIIEYYQFNDQGISFCFENQELNALFLYNKFDKQMKQYTGQIPYNLNMDMTNGNMVAQLGEPVKVSGGKVIPICLTYENLGLEITFMTKSWEDNTSKIYQICLFQKNVSDQFKICGLCKKQTQYKCQKCWLVYYCSKDCQKTHWKVHKNFCQKPV
ncbi:hypothetical protein PPERSA_08459 [Pseudocohnilembus persalinus]|uniref:MYND-type domain-containing protein n=1 Tax=Pseudocohnilembus persalinus TaxID=266149 RepID=A0A0V0R7B7_PSEPJ|nr:hypothetical protein PPERSA_08459 [Pseudocohnilembus persalinus]|eukprot:KRX10056.1 hypothetical protein PPERSA_08459 [Pseudocohnilembus persalinus]